MYAVMKLYHLLQFVFHEVLCQDGVPNVKYMSVSTCFGAIVLANQASDNSWVGHLLFHWLFHWLEQIVCTYSRTIGVSRKFVHCGQIFLQQFSVKTICKPVFRAMLSFRGKQRTQRLSSPWWKLGNRKCWLSDIMQPVERTLLIFDFY